MAIAFPLFAATAQNLALRNKETPVLQRPKFIVSSKEATGSLLVSTADKYVLRGPRASRTAVGESERSP